MTVMVRQQRPGGMRQRARGQASALMSSALLLVLACAGRAVPPVVDSGGMSAAFLGEWKALGPPNESMVVGKEAITFPDFPELNFGFRVVRQRAGVVDLENTSYAADKNRSSLYWRFEVAGTFLHRPALKVSYGSRVGRDGMPEYEASTSYLRPGARDGP